MPLTVSTNAAFREQAEYKVKSEGEGANEKVILDALKQSYAAKVKELEEAEVSCILKFPAHDPKSTRVHLRARYPLLPLFSRHAPPKLICKLSCIEQCLSGGLVLEKHRNRCVGRSGRVFGSTKPAPLPGKGVMCAA